MESVKLQAVAADWASCSAAAKRAESESYWAAKKEASVAYLAAGAEKAAADSRISSVRYKA